MAGPRGRAAERAPAAVTHLQLSGGIQIGAFEKGADGVLIAGCLEGGCHFLEGNLRAKKRTNFLKKTLDEIGLQGERLLMVNLSAAMAPTFVQRVNEIVETVLRLGPSPLNKDYPGRSAADPSRLEQQKGGTP